MGFKDFCKENKNENANDDTEVNMADNHSKKIEELYDRYKDKNEDELLGELFKNVSKQKADGTFNYNSLLDTLNKVSPFLTKEQNLKLKDLLEQIK